MDAIENQYNMIQDAIQNGQAAPDAARTFLNDVLKTNGITLAAPDPLAEQKALLADWNNMQYQYALSHGETPGIVTTDENGNINGLTNAGAAEFSAWYNDNIYGNKNVDGYMSGEKPVTGIIGAPNSTDYLAVMSRATPFDPNSSPSKGQYISNNGVLYYVESDLTAGGSGGANFTVVDVSTGARGQLNPSSMTNGRYTGWTFNGFPTNQSTTTGAGGVTVLPPGSSGR
jgi:hypothetical protein